MTPGSETRFRDALARARAGDAVGARQLLETAFRLDRRHAGIRNALAVLRLESGDPYGAIALFEGLVKELPSVAAIRLNFGNALLAAGQTDRAVGMLERAVKLDAGNPLVMYGLGRAQQTAGNPVSAVQWYEQVLRHQPDHVDARSNLAAALNFLGEYEAAAREARRALQVAPADAGARFNLSVALLSTGQWIDGWAAYESRLETRLLDRQRRLWTQPRWSGRGQAGDTILVHAEQGFGDTIQFVRYLPRLRARGFRVILQCPQTLATLLSEAELCDDVIAFGAALPTHQWQIPLTSLPGALALRDDAEVMGSGDPYLKSPSEEGLPTDFPKIGVRIGLVWAGSPTHVNDRHRSCGFEAFHPLWSLQGVTWVNLQLGPSGDIGAPPVTTWYDARSALTCFTDTARIIARLDAVISVDSAVAHLAGALGTPCFLLLPRIGQDWRWRAEHPSARWYRQVDGIQQEVAGRWMDCVDGLRTTLRERFTLPS